MLKKIRGLLLSDDSRWGVLICLSLWLIIWETLNHSRGAAEGLINRSTSLQSWADFNLVWEHEGALGRGIYSREINATKLVPSLESGAMNVCDRMLDPSLAVFTYRPLDINRADFATLRVLKGVGPKIAATIISYRLKHGPYRRTKDLLEVKGIGPAKYKELCRDLEVMSPTIMTN